MKKIYEQPTIKVVKLHPHAVMLAGSYGKGIEWTEINPNPGGQEDFL